MRQAGVLRPVQAGRACRVGVSSAIELAAVLPLVHVLVQIWARRAMRGRRGG
jgi:hypothetical protein